MTSGATLLHVVTQHLEHLGDANQHRDSSGPDLAHDVGRVVTPHEHRHARQHRWDERGHGLTEHVAERQQVEKTQAGRTDARTCPVLEDLPLDGNDIGQDVVVRQLDPLWARLSLPT